MNFKYLVIFFISVVTIQVIQFSEALPLSNDQQDAQIRVPTGNENEGHPVDEGRLRNGRQYGFGGSNAFASANAGSVGGGFPGGMGFTFSGASASAQAGSGGYGFG